jgi:hypothetical protein
MNETPQTRDEVIEKVRAVREAYAAHFNYDIALLFRHAHERAKRTERKVVKRQPKPVEEVAETP